MPGFLHLSTFLRPCLRARLPTAELFADDRCMCGILQHSSVLLWSWALPWSLRNALARAIAILSGYSAGVFQELISFSSMKVLARRLACLGSLCGYALLIKGSTPFVRISETKNLASIVPSKISNFVGPLFEMPGHTCTLRGCFGFPFSLGCSHSRWKLILL